MTKERVLRWIERALIGIGAVLAAWCLVVVLQMRFYRNVPIPPPPAATEAARPSPADAGAAPPPPRGSWLARLDAPSVKLRATVLEGSDDRTLMKAAGHIEDTALPGKDGNVGIAGHRDTIFRPVRNLHVGDPLVLTTANAIFRYRISRTSIVNPQDVYVLDPTVHPTLTLVTCYPFNFVGHAPRRFIIRAELVEREPRADSGG